MYLLVLYSLLGSFFISIFFGKFFSRRVIGFFTSLCVFFSFLFSIFIFYESGINHSSCEFCLFSWINIDSLTLSFNFLFDSLTSVMLLIITFISLMVHVYSVEYMKNDPHQIRFFSYLSLFTFFMCILVTSGNFIQLFVGWEGVGIVSYLLINFWYSRIDANKSSILAVFVNKIGDISLLVAFSFMFLIYKSLDLNVLFAIFSVDSVFGSKIDSSYYQLIGFLLVIAAIAKSAQLGLHIWLPEAMEGPTPVSSLIHAATMVTAGIFLLIRCSFLFHQLPEICIWIVFIGSITTFFGSTIGVYQYDIKKIIAYSTCSQLGYMFLSCGFISYNYGLYHLINHAFFKALLFLSAGTIIHCFSHEQDFRKMGGFLYVMPFSYISILIGSFSLMGFPFFSGFYSKEGILRLFLNYFPNYFNEYFVWFFLCFFFSYVSVILTLIYSLKLIFYVFFQTYNGFFFNLKIFHYQSLYMMIPLFFLIYFSVFGGFLFFDLFVGAGTDFWNDSMYIPLFDFEYHVFMKTIIGLFFESACNMYIFNFEFFQYMKDLPLFWVLYFFIVMFIFYFFFFTRYFLFNLNFSSFWVMNLFFFLIVNGFGLKNYFYYLL